MPSDTRQRLLDAAIKRFYRDGFRSVGLDQILTDVGISKTAFYKHFESKDELIVSALEHHNVWMQGTFRQLMRQHGGESPVGQLRALVDVIETIMDTDNFQGCIFVNVSMEFPLPHEPAHMAARKSKAEIEDAIRAVAAEAGAADPRRMAQELCLIMEGAYVTTLRVGQMRTVMRLP